MQIQMIDEETENRNQNDKANKKPTKTNNSHYRLMLYLSYPTEEQKQRLRNMAKAFNLENKMRHKRMLKIANTPSEAAQMVMAAKKDRAEADRKYRVWLRRKRKLDEIQYLKEFTAACRQCAKVIKNSRSIDHNQDFQDEQDGAR